MLDDEYGRRGAVNRRKNHYENQFNDSPLGHRRRLDFSHRFVASGFSLLHDVLLLAAEREPADPPNTGTVS
jgi:hypothetical protein